MRADTRSFSFTWLRGQQYVDEVNLGKPSSVLGVSSLSKTLSNDYKELKSEISSEDSITEKKNAKKRGSNSSTLASSTRINGKKKLRRIGSSMFRNISNFNSYNEIIEEEHAESDDIVETKEDQDNFKVGKHSDSISKKFNKGIQDVKSSLGNLSQRICRSAYRKYRVPDKSPLNQSPSTPTRTILGRTPTKLYSPFNFDSPMQNSPRTNGNYSTPRISVKSMTTRSTRRGKLLANLDVKDIHNRFQRFDLTKRDVTRRSVRF